MRLIVLSLVFLIGCSGGAEPRNEADDGGIAEWHVARAAQAYEAGDYVKARMAYAAARELRPSDAKLALDFYRAQVSVAADTDLPLDEEEVRRTDHWIDLLIERFPAERARWLTARGGLRAGLGDAVGAYAALTAAQQADPTYERAVTRFAALLGATDRAVEAEMALDAARKTFPKSLTIRKLLADMMVKRKGYREALDVLGEALRIERLPAIYVQMGEVSLAAGESERAEQTYREALQLSPDLPIAMAGLGYAKLAQGDAAQAKMIFERYLRVAPSRGVPESKVNEIQRVYATLDKSTDPNAVKGDDMPAGMRVMKEIPVSMPSNGEPHPNSPPQPPLVDPPGPRTTPAPQQQPPPR